MTFGVTSIVHQYANNFKGLEKMKDYPDNLYFDAKTKHVAVPPRSAPYHLQARIDGSLEMA